MWKYFNKKGQFIWRFLLFLVPYIRFLFESQKQFSLRFGQISGCSNVLKYFNIFPKIWPSSKFFLFYVIVSYFSTLHQWSYLSWIKPVIPVAHYGWNINLISNIKMLTLKLSAALLYRSGDVRNYFLYKALIYLPIEDIKPFGQNGWSVQTWEPWLMSLSNKQHLSNIWGSIC